MPAEIHTPSAIDPAAARRWARLSAAAPWLHEEIGRRMAGRLDVIGLPVARWADASAPRDVQAVHALVAVHYPKARAFALDEAGRLAPYAAVSPSWWQRWRGAVDSPQPAPEGAMDMVWANMCAHQAADPGALLAAWRRALAPGGFVMFSCFGPDTLRELRALYARLSWPPPAQDFVDMHDWGDWLVTAGFAEPVMDMERITLTFPSAARLLAELRGLGRNLHPARFAGLRTRGWRERLHAELETALRADADQPLALTFEIIYGHALAPQPRHAVQAQTEIPLDQVRAALRRRPGG
ncbi:MAG: methyltransferase domain-containing protein [Burkholderiaceae bacterium]|jgi:malonyl-CoA O-methyltransferase|nr:methyltransferase domain-containing protein [Burkholderiaceae bacterium]